MRKGLLFWVFLMVSLPLLDAKVIYVNQGSNGNGNSWQQAYGSLQQALKAAKKGDEIWVAAGVYVPTHNGDRNISFRLVESVSLYGGFAGFEQTREERNPQLHKTILSGNIGSASADDNSYTVVYAEKISDATIIDGFIISEGMANGTDKGVNIKTCGAAWFNRSASPTITNCIFTNNTARKGAAIYNAAGKAGICSPKITNCTFQNNQADFDGGSIFNDGTDGKCMPVIRQCRFVNNIATYGAGMMNRAVNGMTKVKLVRCHFKLNKSLVKGGAVYNHRDNSGICEVETQDCTFEDNAASVGADINNTRSMSSGGQ